MRSQRKNQGIESDTERFVTQQALGGFFKGSISADKVHTNHRSES
jgi:hypothetical protein